MHRRGVAVVADKAAAARHGNHEERNTKMTIVINLWSDFFIPVIWVWTLKGKNWLEF